MPHDWVIRRGLVVDGSGAEPRVADVALDGGIISMVGEVSAAGNREIDASGLLVTPGFVDVHCHLDAQVGWDPALTPSSSHGITTVLIGNCGVTFAPCRPEDRPALAKMMESVEDIPAEAILDGLPWTWETYGEYLDTVEELRPTINVAGLVGHCAVRANVMGERAVDGDPTEDDIAAIADVVAESLAGGAVGFSTSRFAWHLLPDGRQVPGTRAPIYELIAVAERMGDRGLFQYVLDLENQPEAEMAVVRAQVEATGGPALFTTGVSDPAHAGDVALAELGRLRSDGFDVTAVSIPRPSGLLIGLPHLLYFRGPSWRHLGSLDPEARLAAIDDSAFFADLVSDAARHETGTPVEHIFPLGTGNPTYVDGPECSLGAIADAAGVSPAQAYLGAIRESRGAALFTVRIFNKDLAALERLLSSPHVLPGLGDAGAHVGAVMDAGWTTFTLRHWVRDRGLFGLADGIRRMTAAPASVIGAFDRGTVRPGLRADVNVIDLDRLQEHAPTWVNDLPRGAGRFTQSASGYRATFCNGALIAERDAPTGIRAGKVLRGRQRGPRYDRL